jgi:hypothetical protein
MATALLAPEPVTAQRFARLAAQWKTERGPVSSLSEMVMHPSYQQIIGMGQLAIPFLLRELEQSPDHWFWALMAITGIDPVPPEHRGDLARMSDDWLRWGREQGYAW